MQVLEPKKPYERFVDLVDNDKTKQEYVASLRLFIIHFKIGRWQELEKQPLRDPKTKELIPFNPECEELLKFTKESTEQAEDMIIEYIIFMKKKGLSEGLVTQRVAACRKFFSSNRVNLNWDFIKEYKGKFKKKQKLEAYKHEQIQKLLEICDIRTRVIVLIFASTGIRIGGLPELRKKQLTRIGELFQFTIYENEEEEYITFCTPECAKAIDNYLAYRETAGEVITKESYLIRKEFDSEDIQQVKNECEPVATSTIRNVISKRMIKAGLRKLEHDVDKTHRKQIPIDHGFRMFFTSQLVNANLNTEKRYLLEGHSLQKNDNSYVRVKEELHDEYLKAIPFLTISEENRLKEEVQELKGQQNEIEQMKFEHRLEIKKVKDDLSGQMEEMKTFMFKNILDASRSKVEELKAKGITVDYRNDVTEEDIKKEYEDGKRRGILKEKDCYPLVGDLLDLTEAEFVKEEA